ncbi:hypothetical protein CRE_21125 [Caenorhabditis remanei]|uniref:T20D4.11-like domain-containing protein n=1 Tax=Caenorhabditis remanei TaxID=31234 RepID=E3MEV1_CAERE|nr:hypothetical protein CRE_21125 [Caenorhabditis remanei]
MRQKCSNMLLGITCAMCICIALLVFIVALIYLSIFVIIGQSEQTVTGCSRMDQIRGMKCAPKIEELSLNFEKLDQGYSNPDRFKNISKTCVFALECIEPIKCKTISLEYKFVKLSCAVFDQAANKYNGCLKKLQNRFYLGYAPCLRPLLSTEELENFEVCKMYEMYRDCLRVEVKENCGSEMMVQELIGDVMELHECF